MLVKDYHNEGSHTELSVSENCHSILIGIPVWYIMRDYDFAIITHYMTKRLSLGKPMKSI